jgi:sporulation protein YlmC with PRC-barrel domain
LLDFISPDAGTGCRGGETGRAAFTLPTQSAPGIPAPIWSFAMFPVIRLGAIVLLSVATSSACFAQTATDPTAPAPTPAQSQAATGSPNLAVATVKMEGGTRASKMIGAAVFNDQNQQVGTVDDLILDKADKVVLAVISVGGFLGVGGKLVAVKYEALHPDDKGHVVMPEASKDALGKMPSFTYTG